ncbi:MAG: divalent-cation tolerance protein CutA [Deltaproteobacteria bacterium]|nr:divalent-cation tolerance protein CutA [Deltaproteobacteria bacterium]
MRSKARNRPGKFVIVYTTVEKKTDALRIAGSIVEEGLAACVNVLPALSSVYRWRGRTVRAREHLLIIKTGRSMLVRLEKRIKALSPYELPEFVSMDIDYGSRDYIGWLDRSVSLRATEGMNDTDKKTFRRHV